MRFRSTVQRWLVYATFFSLSIALHMLVILGTKTPSEGTSSATAPATEATAE